jgi:hypothetical protein
MVVAGLAPAMSLLHPILVFGSQVFMQHPGRIADVPGTYPGWYTRSCVSKYRAAADAVIAGLKQNPSQERVDGKNIWRKFL